MQMKTNAKMMDVKILLVVAFMLVVCSSESHAQCASVYSNSGPDAAGNVHAWAILTDNFVNPTSGCAPWTNFTHTYSASLTVTSPSGRAASSNAGGSQTGGGGTATVRTDVFLPILREIGVFTLSGLDTINCSVAGLFYSSSVYGSFSPPPPVINGVSDNSTGSTTIYQGATGYLAIYGTALTAWGETPTPTVTGDSGLTLATNWASDTQVNASYTVDAQAPVGQHTVTLRTATGQAQGRIQVAAPPPPTLQVTWNGTPVSSGSTVYITPVPSLPLVASLIPGAQGVTLTATASWTVGINYIGPGSYEYSCSTSGSQPGNSTWNIGNLFGGGSQFCGGSALVAATYNGSKASLSFTIQGAN